MKRVPTAPGRSVRLSFGVIAATVALLGGGLAVATSAQAVGGTQTFAQTGAEQSYTVPAGVTTVTVTAIGASGAANDVGGLGGLGRIVTADLPVTPGQVLYVEVGGAGVGATGGFNGGGPGGGGGPDGDSGGAGGGASDIRTCPAAGPCSTGDSLDSRLIVAGGGGGAGVNPAGDADTSAPGSSFFPNDGGKAGTVSAGGAGGATGLGGGLGLPGVYGLGGAGGGGIGPGTPGGGGGGGGFYGGGGGGAGGSGGGGGGGASFTAPSATNVLREFDGARQPSVTITAYAGPSITMHPTDAVARTGESATFTATASGTPTPSVQWQTLTDGGWSDIAGATDTTLTVNGVTMDMDGTQYQAVFTNSFGGSIHTATSDAATLTVGDPLVITTASLPNGTVGVDYSATLTTNDGGSYMWALADGSQLPDGLELSPDGVIEGTPTVAGPVTFTVIVNETTRAELTLTIDPAPVVEPTDPATVPPTDEPTVPPTDASTAAPTAPETTAAPETSAPPAAAGTPSSPALPRTGASVTPIVIGAGVLLLAGIVALVVTSLNRRNRRR